MGDITGFPETNTEDTLSELDDTDILSRILQQSDVLDVIYLKQDGKIAHIIQRLRLPKAAF